MYEAGRKLFQVFALFILFISSAYSQSGLVALDGNWYSAKWKYGYILQNGVGTATSTNSPNFQVGQNIIQLNATSSNTFSGRQVYTDGKFYKVEAKLQSDGQLYFEGEKNAKWVMERVGAAPQAVAPSSSNTSSQNAVATNNSTQISSAPANTAQGTASPSNSTQSPVASANTTQNNVGSASSPQSNTRTTPNQNNLEKHIQDRLNQVEQENIRAAEASGDYSQSQIDKSKIGAPPKATKVVISGEFDLKGIKIGMSSEQVSDILKKSVKDIKKCGYGKGGVEFYIFRDYSLFCNESFSFFGIDPQFAEFHFIDNADMKSNRLIWARIGNFYSESDNREAMPPLVKALAEKMKANPETIDRPHSNARAKGVGIYEFIWSDSNKSKLVVDTNYRYDNTGVIHKNQKIELKSADFDSVVESRKLKLQTLQQEQLQKAEQKKKSDL